MEVGPKNFRLSTFMEKPAGCPGFRFWDPGFNDTDCRGSQSPT
jgi:hypothetical protein